MENASKALLIAASVMIGVMIFAIFIYEIAYVSNMSQNMKDTMNYEEILAFNAQFETYADREAEIRISE